MNNRGSKSVIGGLRKLKLYITVKEQRVYGSWCGTNLPHLRCTLMGFERNYQIGILSNQKIKGQFRYYTSISQASPIPVNLSNGDLLKLNS